MEYVFGITLYDLIKRASVIPEPVMVAIVKKVI